MCIWRGTESWEQETEWYASSRENDYWTLLILSWYKSKEIFNTIESQKMLKQAVLPSHIITSLGSSLTLDIIWLEMQLDKCQSEPKRSLPPKGVVLVFSSLHISSPPPLIPQGLVFCLWAELASHCLWIYWLRRGRVNVRAREAGEEMLRALFQQQGAVRLLQTISLTSSEGKKDYTLK